MNVKYWIQNEKSMLINSYMVILHFYSSLYTVEKGKSNKQRHVLTLKSKSSPERWFDKGNEELKQLRKIDDK
jgi:hypothetical protein